MSKKGSMWNSKPGFQNSPEKCDCSQLSGGEACWLVQIRADPQSEKSRTQHFRAQMTWVWQAGAQRDLGFAASIKAWSVWCPPEGMLGGSHQPYRGCKVVEGLYAAGAHHCWMSPHTLPGDRGTGAEKAEPIPPDQEEKLLSSCNVLPATPVDTASHGGPGAEEMLEGV